MDRSRGWFILYILGTLLLALGAATLFLLHQKQVQIRTLQGLIPICTHCKSVRTDSGFYEKLETYISENSEAQFSHGICPECYKKYYPEYEDDEDQSS